MRNIITDITAVSICSNTKFLIARSYLSLRAFHPEMKVIIVDGSSPESDCYNYVRSLACENTVIYQPGYNIGHGNGMHYALSRCTTKYALIFDSDIVMTKSPVQVMLNKMESDTYGVGWIYDVGLDGFDYGTPGKNHALRIPYIHPYFMLLSVKQYFNFAPFVHHGAPCYKAMIDIYKRGLSGKILKSIPGLTGHTSGEGINWKGQPSEYIQHEFGGTRRANREAGKREIEGAWQC